MILRLSVELSEMHAADLHSRRPIVYGATHQCTNVQRSTFNIEKPTFLYNGLILEPRTPRRKFLCFKVKCTEQRICSLVYLNTGPTNALP